MTDQDDVTTCPLCGGRMAVRTSHAGGQFWGCRNFPLCRGTRPIYENEDSGSDTTLPSERARERDRQRWRNET